MKITTKSGFVCEINPNKVKDWRYVRNLAKMRSGNDMDAVEGLAEILAYMFGERENDLYNHVASMSEDGIATTDAVINELKDVQNIIGEVLKNSTTSLT